MPKHLDWTNGLKTVETLLLLVVFVMTLREAAATPPQPPEMSDEGKRLLQQVEELDAKQDVEGLLGALKAAQGLPPHDQGLVLPKIINALRRVEPEVLKADRVVEALTPVAKRYTGAVGLLARIGTDPAGRVVADLARTSRDEGIRHEAIACLAGFKSPDLVRLLIEIASDKKEKPELRRAAISGLQDSSLTSEQYHIVFDIAVTDPSDPLDGTVFEPAVVMRRVPDGAVSAGGHPAAMGPLLDALVALSQRIGALQGKEDQGKAREDAARCFKRGFSALHVSLPPLARRVGYSMRFGERLSVSKDGKEVFSYDRRTAEEDAKERTRVLAFWRTWWEENSEAVLKETGKAAKNVVISRAKAVEIARQAIEGKMRYDKNLPVDVKLEDGRYRVTFPISLPKGTRGPAYAARVTVDAESGKVLKIELAS